MRSWNRQITRIAESDKRGKLGRRKTGTGASKDRGHSRTSKDEASKSRRVESQCVGLGNTEDIRVNGGPEAEVKGVEQAGKKSEMKTKPWRYW